MAIATFRKIFPPEDCVKPCPAHTLSGETPWELREGMMSMVPLIFIPGRECRLGNYARAVRRAGGVPRFAPDGADGWEDCAGLLLPGGGDLDPALYGREDRGSQPPDRDRDRRELALLEAALSAGMPVLGICRGIQVINVFFGGTLVQDLPGHSQTEGRDRLHRVRAEPHSLSARIYGPSFLVNSAHHQAVDRPGTDLRITVRAEDGTAEALAHGSLPVWGFQWHPERLGHGRPPGTVDGELVFDFFLAQCRRRLPLWRR